MFTVTIEQVGGSMNQAVNLNGPKPVREVLAMKGITNLDNWDLKNLNGSVLGPDDLVTEETQVILMLIKKVKGNRVITQ